MIAGGVAFLALLAGVMLFLALSLEGHVARTIERQGSAMTGTDVHVTSVDLSLKSGKGRVERLRIGNPEQFSSSDALEFGDVSLEIDLASLAKDVIVIDTLRIARPVARVELDSKGLANLRVIQQHVESYSGRKGPDGEIKDLRIRRATVEGGTIEVDATALGKGRETLQLRTIELTNVGGKSGAPPDEVGQDILVAVQAEILKAVARRGLERVIDEKTGGMKDKLKGLFRKGD